MVGAKAGAQLSSEASKLWEGGRRGWSVWVKTKVVMLRVTFINRATHSFATHSSGQQPAGGWRLDRCAREGVQAWRPKLLCGIYRRFNLLVLLLLLLSIQMCASVCVWFNFKICKCFFSALLYFAFARICIWVALFERVCVCVCVRALWKHNMQAGFCINSLLQHQHFQLKAIKMHLKRRVAAAPRASINATTKRTRNGNAFCIYTSKCVFVCEVSCSRIFKILSSKNDNKKQQQLQEECRRKPSMHYSYSAWGAINVKLKEKKL